MRLNRVFLLPMLLAGCTAAADDQKAKTDANQADKLFELQTRVEKLEKRAGIDPIDGKLPPALVAAPEPTVDPGTEARLRKLEMDKIDRDAADANAAFEKSLGR